MPPQQEPHEPRDQGREHGSRWNLPHQACYESRRKAKKGRNEHGKRFITSNFHREDETTHKTDDNKNPIKHEDRSFDRNFADIRHARDEEDTPAWMAEWIQAHVAKRMHDPTCETAFD